MRSAGNFQGFRGAPLRLAKQIIDLMHGLGSRPRTTRMASIAVYGDSGMGNSMIVGASNPTSYLSQTQTPPGKQNKFLVVELSSGPGERRLRADPSRARRAS
ncbi:TniB family NTP-binding protein [Methylocystis echinoides]|uniref:TniB family NTP-binding protein n=1 Tax=Methylocystis echinoides TaxID=29468 RepID=UPI003431A961